MDSTHTSLTFQTTLKQPSLNTGEFCIVKVMTTNRILRILLTPYLIPFFTRRMKLLSRHDDFMLYGKLGIDFFLTSELLYPNMEFRLRLIRARPNFYKIIDNPNVSLGIVDCSPYTRRTALEDDYHKKRMDMLAYAPVEHKWLQIWQRHSSYQRDKTNSFKKTFSTMLPFVESRLQWTQTLPSLVLLLKTHSGINNLISDKLEYSEGDSQL